MSRNATSVRSAIIVVLTIATVVAAMSPAPVVAQENPVVLTCAVTDVYVQELPDDPRRAAPAIAVWDVTCDRAIGSLQYGVCGAYSELRWGLVCRWFPTTDEQGEYMRARRIGWVCLRLDSPASRRMTCMEITALLAAYGP